MTEWLPFVQSSDCLSEKERFCWCLFKGMLVCLTYSKKNPHRYLLKLEHGVSTKIPEVQIILVKKMYEKSKVVITSWFFGLDNRTKLTKLWNAKRWKYKNGICFGLPTWDGWKEYSENSSYTWAYKYHIYYGHTHNTWSKSSHANPACSVKDYDFPDLKGEFLAILLSTEKTCSIPLYGSSA